jgi:hypothetical protein
MLDPDMSASEIRLHMGELTGNEVLIVRAAIRWANRKARLDIELLDEKLAGREK